MRMSDPCSEARGQHLVSTPMGLRVSDIQFYVTNS